MKLILVKLLTFKIEYIEFTSQVLDELMDGDIIVFEKEEKDEDLELPTCLDYFKYIFFKVEVQFIEKTMPNDPGYVLVFT